MPPHEHVGPGALRELLHVVGLERVLQQALEGLPSENEMSERAGPLCDAGLLGKS